MTPIINTNVKGEDCPCPGCMAQPGRLPECPARRQGSWSNLSSFFDTPTLIVGGFV
ncbi:MAG TPA: hypothetical protein PLL90_04600 [Bacteroidales bacterium]|nr:hypothetical protein [Bacteroidales bacterium]